MRPIPQNQAQETPSLNRRLPLLVCILLAAVMMFANYIPLVVLNMLPFLRPLVQSSIWMELFFGMLAFSLILLACLFFVHLASKYVLGARLKDIGWVWTGRSLPYFFLGWGLIAVTMVAGQLSLYALGMDDRLAYPGDTTSAAMVVITLIGGIGQGVLMQGIPEELIWRGWLMNCLRERPLFILILSATIFGLLHFVSRGGQQSTGEFLLYMVHAGFFALLGGALALRLRSLWAAFGVHSGLHLTNTLLSFTPLRSEAPLLWAIEILFWLVLSIVLLKGFQGDRVDYRY